MPKTKLKKPVRLHYDITLLDPKPNPLFTEWQTAYTKGLRYTQPVKCAYCGRMSKNHWTQLKFFRIAEGFEMKLPTGKVVAEAFQLTHGKELFPPLTPVCEKHILAPVM